MLISDSADPNNLLQNVLNLQKTPTKGFRSYMSINLKDVSQEKHPKMII